MYSSELYKREFHTEATARTATDNTLVFHPAHIDEGALWRAFKAGDEKALISIFDRFAKVLFNYGIKIYGEREVVKDAVQELFIGLWKNKQNLSDTDSIKFYLFRSLRRKLHRIKKSKVNSFLQLSENDDAICPPHEFFMVAEQTMFEQRERLMKMLDNLTSKQQEAIFLRYFEELSYDKIAGIMEMNKQSVYNLIHKGICQLRKLACPPI